MMTKKFIWFFAIFYLRVLVAADRYQGKPIQVIYVRLPDGTVVHPYAIRAKYRPARITTAKFVSIAYEYRSDDDSSGEQGTP